MGGTVVVVDELIDDVVDVNTAGDDDPVTVDPVTDTGLSLHAVVAATNVVDTTSAFSTCAARLFIESEPTQHPCPTM